MKPLKTNCGDWHLGWGLGGNDKIGKLSLDVETMKFTWEGYSQGRHGQKWNKGANCVFVLCQEGADLELTSVNGTIPRKEELLRSAKELITRITAT